VTKEEIDIEEAIKTLETLSMSAEEFANALGKAAAGISAMAERIGADLGAVK
jgi:hypothetical protein